MPIKHQPVLLEAVTKLLGPNLGEVYLDLTAGYGGHAAAIAEHTQPQTADDLVLVDRDRTAVEALRMQFKVAKVLHQDFATAAATLRQQAFAADMILLDLGVSSPQLESANRGFSFTQEGPLDMRMDQTGELTAADIVNTYAREDLANLIFAWGERRMSRRIAAAIVEARPLTSTTALAQVIARAIGRRGRIHPATRTFQALRIAVNDEMGQLEQVLPLLVDILSPGGRLAIISFHSLEDRTVKQFIRSQTELTALTKKPLAGKTQDPNNPRARSAKLRVAIKNKKEN